MAKLPGCMHACVPVVGVAAQFGNDSEESDQSEINNNYSHVYTNVDTSKINILKLL